MVFYLTGESIRTYSDFIAVSLREFHLRETKNEDLRISVPQYFLDSLLLSENLNRNRRDTSPISFWYGIEIVPTHENKITVFELRPRKLVDLVLQKVIERE